MGGKSLRSKHDNRIARAKMLRGHFTRDAKDYANITTDNIECASCGFKARYKFIRCPECGEVRETK